MTETIDKLLGWTKGISERFKAFMPDTRSVTINYREQKSEIGLHIQVPKGTRRHLATIMIPAYEGFSVSSMLDESFVAVTRTWKLKDNWWILDPMDLPSSEHYLVTLKGPISQKVLDQLVRVQPATNRDQKPGIDRYWLNCMIRNQSILERMCQDLQIQEVDVRVKVGIERCFSVAIPSQLKRQFEAVDRYMRAGFGKDREEVKNAWLALLHGRGTRTMATERVADLTRALTESGLFREYVTVDPPFVIGDVRRNERFVGLFPSEMFVEASTELCLRTPACTGYLSFKKKEYIDAIKDELENTKKV